jgi:hypothetical protein
MLDREVVREFLNDKLQAFEIEVPKDIHDDSLVETFCRYVEDDYSRISHIKLRLRHIAMVK